MSRVEPTAADLRCDRAVLVEALADLVAAIGRTSGLTGRIWRAVEHAQRVLDAESGGEPVRPVDPPCAEVIVGWLVTHEDGYQARLGPDEARAQLYAVRQRGRIEAMYVRREIRPQEPRSAI